MVDRLTTLCENYPARGGIRAAPTGENVMELFISYARADRPRAAALAEQLKQAGNVVWLDSDLRVGQAWWDKILDRIRSCDAVVVGVSQAALTSVACRREREYAMQLGKSVLPLTFEPINTVPLPTDIARLQAYDYSQPDANSGFVVMGALSALPAAPPLPNPLPSPPDMPPPPLADLVDLLNQPQLSKNDQFAIIGQLEVALGPGAGGQERAVATELLRQLAARPELLQSVAQRIATLQARAGQQVRQPPGGRPPRGKLAPKSVSPRWGMAISTAVLTFAPILLCPIGIVALVSASRTGPNFQAGNLAAAQRSSSRVKAMFWTAVVLWVIFIIGWIVSVAGQGYGLNQPEIQPTGLAPVHSLIL